MKSRYIGLIIGSVCLAAAASYGSTVIYTAGSVNTLDTNAGTYDGAAIPGATGSISVSDAASNTTLTEGETLAGFQALITTAYANNTGGVMNFEEADESNGSYNTGSVNANSPTPAFSWPSQNQSATNSLEIANGPTNAVQVNYGASQPTSTVPYTNAGAANTAQLSPGTNSVTFWRDLYTGASTGVPVGSGSNVALGFTPITNGATVQTNTNDALDANNGENAISGDQGTSPTSGNGYLGIQNDGEPVILDFTSDPLSAFGINVLNRGAARALQVDVTLADGTVLKSSNESTAGNANIFYGFNLTAADLLTHGGIIYATFDSANTDRYDDLAFIVAPTPEPATIGLLSVGGLALLRRRRTA
jgi:hypothetical protein